ncbi:MAG: hypothetical protein WCK28_02775 [Burkholderiales bacterium]|jgi:hypothetical protein
MVNAMAPSICRPETVATLVARIVETVLNESSTALLDPTSGDTYRRNIATTYGGDMPPVFLTMTDDLSGHSTTC